MFRQVPVGGGAVGNQFPEIEFLAFKFQGAAVHLGIVQDIRDHREQILGGLPGGVQVLPLAMGERLFLDQIHHAENPVERVRSS